MDKKELINLRKEVQKWLKDPELLKDVYITTDILEKIVEMRKNYQSIQKYIAAELSMTPYNISRKVKKLREHNLVRIVNQLWYNDMNGKRKRDAKAKLLELTEKGHNVLTYSKTTQLPKKKIKKRSKQPIHKIPPSAREFHSEQLRKVINRLIDTFIIIDNRGAYEVEKFILSGEDNEFFNKKLTLFRGGELNIEHTETLFSDLENHLMFFNKKPFIRVMNDFKQLCKKYNGKINGIKNEINLSLMKHFEREVSNLWETGYLSLKLQEYIYDATFYLASRNLKFYNEYFKKFESKIEEEKTGEGEEILVYRVGPYGFLKELKEEWESKEDFKKYMDEKLHSYLENLKKAPFFEEMEACAKSMEEINLQREIIIQILKKNLAIPIYPGDCTYLQPYK